MNKTNQWLLVWKILVTSWWSTMTLYDFYLVTQETAKWIKAYKLEKQTIWWNMSALEVVPLIIANSPQISKREKEPKPWKKVFENWVISYIQITESSWSYWKRMCYLWDWKKKFENHMD